MSADEAGQPADPGADGGDAAGDSADGTATDGDAPGESTEARVREALRDIIDPCSAATGSCLDVVEMGLVKRIDVEPGDDGDQVEVDLRLTSPMCHQVPYFYEEIEGTVGDLEGVASATLDTDYGLEWTEDMLSEEAKRKRQAVLDDQEARYRREMGLASE